MKQTLTTNDIARKLREDENAGLSTGCFPPEPFRFAGRSFTGSAVLALRRAYGEHRLQNACVALDALPYDDNLKAIANWCYADGHVQLWQAMAGRLGVSSHERKPAPMTASQNRDNLARRKQARKILDDTATELAADVEAAHRAQFAPEANKLQAVQSLFETRGLHNRGWVGDCTLRTAHRNAVRAAEGAQCPSSQWPAGRQG